MTRHGPITLVADEFGPVISIGAEEEPMPETAKYVRPEYEGPVPGETSTERTARSGRNTMNRLWWAAVTSDRCSECGHVRFHVSHEMDPATSPEGIQYHSEIEHHPFVGTVR